MEEDFSRKPFEVSDESAKFAMCALFLPLNHRKGTWQRTGLVCACIPAFLFQKLTTYPFIHLS
jgi:hypothetical protein